jgi:hypothetical protein
MRARPAIRSRLLPALLAGAGLACAPPRSVSRVADSAAVAALARERLAAASRGDTALWHRQVADGAIWSGPVLALATNDAVLTEIASNRITHPAPLEVRDLGVYLYGDVALVSYLALTYQPGQPPSSGKRFRKTDTYRRRGQTWELIGGTELLVPYRPEAHPTPQRMAPLLGRYVLGESDTLTVRLVPGVRLVLDGSGSVDSLLAADDTTFFVDGDLGSWVFAGASAGRVRALVYRAQGQVDISLRRIP